MAPAAVGELQVVVVPVVREEVPIESGVALTKSAMLARQARVREI